jgi:hypothetical protein
VTPFDAVHECPREQEILDALAADAAVENWTADLREHAEACEICRDVVAVALPLLQEHRAVVATAQPPSSGVVWWRAQMRARHEAAAMATRPITVVQALAVVAGTVVLLAILSAAAPVFSGWLGDLSLFGGSSTRSWTEWFTLPKIELASLVPSTSTGVLLACASAICLLIGPLAVYFALGDD